MQNNETLNEDSFYERNDIYYCSCCGLFYDSLTHQTVNVPYTEMPAEMALQVMYDRGLISQMRARRKRTGKGKGFGNN